MPVGEAEARLRVGVTGANGLVGRALRHRLVGERGITPVFYTRRAPASLEERQTPDLQAGDVAPWVEALAGVEVLIHLAAALPWTAPDRESLHRINVEGTRILAQAAIAAGVRRIVFVSTLGVHGTVSGAAPFTPDSPIAPSGPYAVTKYEAETLLRQICEGAGVEVVILRPPVVYGAGVGGKLGRLVAWTGRGARLPMGRITGNRRQMIAAENLADALVLAARHPQAPGPALLPADGEGLSTHALLTRLAALQGQTLRLWPIPEKVIRLALPFPVLGPYAERLIGSVEICDTRLYRELGWHPPCTLDDALARMIGGEGTE